MGSQRRARSATDAAGRPPSSASLAFLVGSTSKPTTSKPGSSSRCANAWPSSPMPIRPTGLRAVMSLIHHRQSQTGATFLMSCVGPLSRAVTSSGRSVTSTKRRDAEIARGRLETLAQRLGHGDPVLGAVLPLEMALLPGQPDVLDTRQPLAAPHAPDPGIHLALESPPPPERFPPH